MGKGVTTDTPVYELHTEIISSQGEAGLCRMGNVFVQSILSLSVSFPLSERAVTLDVFVTSKLAVLSTFLTLE